MSTATLALGAATAALALAIALSVLVIRGRRAADRRVTRELIDMGERLDLLSRELVGTVDRIREDAQRARLVESLTRALDVEEVAFRCAEAASLLPGVQGAAVRVEIDGATVTASSGLAPDAAPAVSGPPDGRPVRAVGLSYHYRAPDVGDSAFRSAVAVPLEGDEGHLGFLTVFGRDDEPPVAGTEFQTLEAIARLTAPALLRARSLAAQPQLETDDLTGLGTRERFHATLALEVARAQRHGRRLAVCVLDLDDFRLANQRVGQIAADALLVEVASLVRDTIRPGDLACRIGGDEFAVLLAESGRIEAEGMFARLQASLRRRPLQPGPTLSFSAGIAELKPDDDGVSLYERAERALHRAKDAGKGTAA